MLKPTLLSWMLASLCAASGTILYVCTFGLPGGAWANLLWGSLYGLGFLTLSFFFSPMPGIGGLFLLIVGTFIWPLIVTVALAQCAERLMQSRYARWVIGLTLATNLVVYPMTYAPGTFVYYLPIYGVFLGNF